MFAKSIRNRFQLWLAFLLVAILSGFGFTAFQLYRSSQLAQIDADLQRRVASLITDVRGPGGPGGPGGRRGFGFGPPPPDDRRPPQFEDDREIFHFRRGGGPGRGGPDGEFRGPPPFFQREIRLSSRTSSLFDETDTNNFYFAVWSPMQTILKQSTNAPAGLARPVQSGRDTTLQFENRGDFREAHQYTERGDSILVGRSIADFKKASQQFAILLLVAGGGILGLGLGGGWILATRALRPVTDISLAATRISAGNLSERINVEDTDSELGQLAKLLNATFGRLDAAFAQQKQFTADAAHELRTPLAVIISETQTTLARPRNADEYRETVEACLETAQRMRALTHSLLELARFDAGQESMQKAPFDLTETVQSCVELLEPLARERGIQIRTDLRPATINGDRDRILQVITNLLSNAIHYNKDNGKIDVALREGILTIADTGQGISETDLPHIFERFYRADQSRSRSSGRSGLGLAISKAILDAHQAQIKVASKPGEGTTFMIRF